LHALARSDGDDGEADKSTGGGGDLGVTHGVVEIELGVNADELD
jgi:hypothetical protein